MFHSQQVVTFEVGNLFLGIDVLKVQEVIHYEEPTAVPLAPHSIAGLINLRGLVVSVVDLRKQFSFDERPAHCEPKIVIIQHTSDKLGLVIDNIGEVVDVDRSSSYPTPTNLPQEFKDILTSVFKLEKRLLLELSVDKIFSTSNYSKDGTHGYQGLSSR